LLCPAGILAGQTAGLLLDSALQMTYLSANENGLTLTKYVLVSEAGCLPLAQRQPPHHSVGEIYESMERDRRPIDLVGNKRSDDRKHPHIEHVGERRH
jgi:hypothetical protein